MRTVDLARAAGVSTQQIRNYEEAGLLPPVPRTDSGYRTFDERHLKAVLAYRALAAGHGPEAARGIMHAVLAGDVAGALALVDAGHAALHEERASSARRRPPWRPLPPLPVVVLPRAPSRWTVVLPLFARRWPPLPVVRLSRVSALWMVGLWTGLVLWTAALGVVLGL
ncbi:MerR family DNA-binding transcriptional regulator [Phytohabitans flavus]|uniref:MerR family DNA-binding transcriptional regulator n=1 Tax=Phytohabitans flavus TaxID=1076124 RepID=UPI00362BDD2A